MASKSTKSDSNKDDKGWIAPVGLNALDLGAKLVAAYYYVPKLKASANVLKTGASLGSCGVSGASNVLIFAEVLGSGVIVALQAYSIYVTWTELKALDIEIKASNETIDSIDKNLKALMDEFKLLCKKLDDIKDKKEEDVTLDEIQDLLLQVNETSIRFRKVYRPVSKINLYVSGKIESLKINKTIIKRDAILSTGQILSHVMEFAVYASCPMGTLFFVVKGCFTLAYVGITTAKVVQHHNTSKRLKELQAMFNRLEVYESELEKIDDLLIENLELLKAKKEEKKQTNRVELIHI